MTVFTFKKILERIPLSILKENIKINLRLYNLEALHWHDSFFLTQFWQIEQIKKKSESHFQINNEAGFSGFLKYNLVYKCRIPRKTNNFYKMFCCE